MIFLKKYRIAILAAIVVGLCAVAPSILAPLTLGSEYHGIQFLPFSDDVRYLARVHDVLDGHPLLSSPYLYEYKNGPVVVPPINEWFYAFPAYLFGLTGVVVTYKFLLPAAIFLLVFFLVKGIVGTGPTPELGAITAGLAVVLGADMVNYGQLFAAMMGTSPPSPLLWTRLVNPVLGGVQLFAFVLLMWHVWARGWRHAYILAGIVLASSIGYFFTFGTALSILAVVGAFALVRKEFDIVLRCVWIFLISLVLDAWFWYNTVLSVGGEGGRALAARNGMFFTHAHHLNKALLVATLFVLASFLYAYVWKKHREDIRTWLFTWALIIGGWLVFNEQVITGREVWYYHFVQYTVPLGIITCIIALHLLLQKSAPRLLIGALIAISAASGAYGLSTVQNYVSRMPEFARLQGYAPLIAWLNTNAPKDCVVLDGKRNEELVLLIPAYTGCNTYTTTSLFFGVAPERIQHNLLLRMRFEGVKAGEATDYLRTHADDVRNSYYADWNQLFGRGEDPWILDRISTLGRDYTDFMRGNLETQVRSFRVDYIVFGHPLSPVLRRALPDLTLATTTGNFYIYAF